MNKTKEFTKRLNWIANRLKVDAGDLNDWYKNDIDDICEMKGDTLLSIVREYLSLRSWYRSLEAMQEGDVLKPEQNNRRQRATPSKRHILALDSKEAGSNPGWVKRT